MKTLYNIQLARAVAALLVVYAHIGIPKATFGHFGVDIFFVISGFIMTLITAETTEGFFLRRLVRIVPLYWLVTFSVLLLSYCKPEWLNSTTPNVGHFLQSLFFIPYQKENGSIHPMLDVGWTLNYEMYFYTAIALAALWASPPYAARIAAMGLILIYCFLNIILIINPPLPSWLAVSILFYSSFHVCEFVLGVLTYYICQSTTFNNLGTTFNLGAIFASLIFLIYDQLAHPFGYAAPLLTQGLPSMIFVSALLLLEQKNIVFTKRTLLGDASYAIYLTNQYVVEGFRKIIVYLFHISMFSIFSCVLIMVASSLVGIFVFTFIENPIHLKLKLAITRWRPKKFNRSSKQ